MKKNSWESKYLEKNNNESHIYLFKSLEIKQYIRQYLKNYGFVLNKFKLSFSGSILHLFISIYKTEQAKLILEKNKQNKKKKKTDIIKKYYESLNTKFLLMLKKTKKQYNINKKSKTKKIRLATFNQLQLLKTLNKTYSLQQHNKQKKYKTKTLKKLNKASILNLLNSINTFSDYKLPINLKIKFINNIKPNLQKHILLVKLGKFQKTSFFEEGKHLLFTLTNSYHAANLLAIFISTQLKKLKKQHNYFFNFLKENLNFIIKQKSSKIQGVKIVVQGRLNNSARSKRRIIVLGKIPLITIKSNINYFKSTAYTSNGTFGVKVWVCQKNNY